MIEQLLHRIAETLDAHGIPYMIIGGQAVLIHGRPRLTEDVDITLGVDTDEFRKVFECSCKLKFRPLRADPERFAEQTKVLPVEDPSSRLRVDFVFSNTPYEREAVRRAMKVKIDSYPVKFASAEDLIIHKIFADRAIDLEDAKAVLIRKGKDLDRSYIRKWLRLLGEAAEGSEDLVSIWQRLCRETDATRSSSPPRAPKEGG